MINLFWLLALSASIIILPDEWSERMNFSNMQKDGSFGVRAEIWNLTLHLALDHPIWGGGFQAMQVPEIFMQYKQFTKLDHPFAAHSIYFQALNDGGFVGLGIFLSVIAVAFYNNYRIKNIVKDVPSLRWCYQLAGSFQISLMTYCVGGTALSLDYFDLFYILVGLSFNLHAIVLQYEKETRKQQESEHKKYSYKK